MDGTEPIRAITVSVNYSDILSLTLKHNRRHFAEMCVVTSKSDGATVEVAKANDSVVFQTDSFWSRGAMFAKWLALEEALDWYGRSGWLLLLDADILLPSNASWLNLIIGNLYTPLRRMWSEWPKCPDWLLQIPPYTEGMVSEKHWHRFPLHPQQQEFAGYHQLLSADDPHLPQPPWHDVNFTSAGTADSLFQDLWPQECKVRPPFQVLHLGPAGANWMGRVTPLADGSVPAEAEERKAKLREMLSLRRGKVGMARFDHERLKEK